MTFRKVPPGFCKRAIHKGITLTECLIAMGVASIGMFGVFVLIPFCARQAQLGQDYDASAQVAKAAVDHFKITGMNNPDRWVDSGGGNVVDNTTDNVDRFGAATPDGIPDWKQRQYCIDPLGLTGFAKTANFPDVAMPSSRKMNRISLRGITEAMSDFHFRSRDDLIFDDPEDKADLPILQAVPATGAPLTAASRGDISWMAMIEPQPGHESGDMWRLYVVVFKQREQTANAEKRYDVSFIDQGISGGDVTLAAPPNEDFRLRRNSWVMLQIQSPDHSTFAWYRVSSADEEEWDKAAPPASVNTHVTLQGPDWPLAGGVPVPASAIFIPEVIMVYEKTIRLEFNSSWSFD